MSFILSGLSKACMSDLLKILGDDKTINDITIDPLETTSEKNNALEDITPDKKRISYELFFS